MDRAIAGAPHARGRGDAFRDVRKVDGCDARKRNALSIEEVEPDDQRLGNAVEDRRQRNDADCSRAGADSISRALAVAGAGAVQPEQAEREQRRPDRVAARGGEEAAVVISVVDDLERHD